MKWSSKAGNSPSQARHNQKSFSVDADDQPILAALQGFIVSLVRDVVDSKREDASIEICQGPEATDLLIALKEFISRTINTREEQDTTTMEVSLVKEDKTLFSMPSGERKSKHGINEIMRPLPLTVTFHDKVVRALRHHVFNRMPIRLLRFEPNDSCLQISLVERGAIFSYLASRMRNVAGSEYGPKYIPFEEKMETEEAAINRLIWQYAGYAILSHTWLRSSPGEVTYADWNKKKFSAKDPGYQKIIHFCQAAWNDHGLTLGWMDTICINKDSSSELDESIRSMFSWYQRSTLCIGYLAETTSLVDMHLDPWFTRGWTLQELFAPRRIKLYNLDWKCLDDNILSSDKSFVKNDLTQKIQEIMSISDTELNDSQDMPFSRKLQLAANRQVTREEDMAYSLMGLFNVSMSIAYGEGADRAFFRLLREILDSNAKGVLDLFNWAGEVGYQTPHTTRILPPNIQYYLTRSSSRTTALERIRPLSPLTLTHMGICIPALLMPGTWYRSRRSKAYKPRGSYGAVINISPIGIYGAIPSTYHLLDSRVRGPDGSEKTGRHQYTFAVLNIQQDTEGIVIPETCFAIALECAENAGSVSSTGEFYHVETCAPILFEMSERNLAQSDESADDFMLLVRDRIYLSPEKLALHGMQLVNKYL